MYKIQKEGERTSDKIIRQFTAELLNVPETDEDAARIAAACPSCNHEKVAADCECGKEDCVCSKSGKCASLCPQCGGNMQKSGNLSRCACGYATASKEALDESIRQASVKRKASDISVTEYYKKIFPDDYVADLVTDSPKTPAAGKDVQYGKVDVNKKVSFKEILASDFPDCEIPDNHPESGVNCGSGSEETPDPKWQKGDSANSVSGPEKAKSHGPGSGGDFPDTQAPDLGLPRGARKGKTHVCGSDEDPGCPWCGEPEKKKDDDKKSGSASKVFISREVLGEFSPQLAVQMKALGVKGLSARFIANVLKDAIQQRVAVSPPGMAGLTEHMKEHSEIDNPFALAWWMKGEGYKPRKKRYPSHD